MKRFVIIIAATFIVLSSFSQQFGYYIDGIKNTDNYYFGTARSMSLGGAFSSLGGDLGSVQINPAGLGVYRNSEFVISPGLSSLSTSSKFFGTNTDNLDYRFTMSNVGMVFNFKTNNSNGWEGANLAFGYNKMNNFNNSYTIKGTTSNTSLMNEYVSNAKNTHPDYLASYWERLAYDLALIDTDSTLKYTSPFIGINLQQLRTMESTGSIGEYYMGFGANYNHKLYVGLSINIRSGYYKDVYCHKETDIDTLISDNYYTFNYSLNSIIRGWNAKFGAIYRPIETLRLGFSIHTPTIIDIEQELSTSMQAVDDNNYKYNMRPSDSDGNPIENFLEKYTITTPLRIVGGVAYMFQDKGLVSFDYEYADYSKIQFSNATSGTNQEDLIIANADNKKIFRKTHNFRTGAEAKINSFYLRGGFAFYASPYAKGELNSGANTLTYSGGVGYRNNGFSIDFGYSLLTKSEKYYMYYDTNLQPATLKTKNGTFLLTAGFRF